MRRIKVTSQHGQSVFLDSSYIASIADSGDSYRIGYAATITMKNGDKFQVMESGAHIVALIDAVLQEGQAT